MSYSLLSKAEIERSRQSEEIIRETAAQVLKDFANFGMELEFPADLRFAYDELYRQMVPLVISLMERKPEKLSALLYQIDLDEKKMKNPEGELFSEGEWLTGLILEREFLKVLTRFYFKTRK